MADARLRITEIFHSLQGEGLTTGVPTVFVRLTGCPLRCNYCDTAYAFKGGQWMPLDDILGKVRRFHCKNVTVTGGEPLAQPDCIPLLQQLCDEGYEVSLETSGALDMAKVPGKVCKVMDLKTPDSGEQDKNNFANLEYLTAQDQIKFVIASESDYHWSKEILQRYKLNNICTVLFSPVWQTLDLRSLAEWILRDHLPVRLQLQLHKVIWGDKPGH